MKHGETIYVAGSAPFDRETGEINSGDIKRQTEIVFEQLKAPADSAGSSLEKFLNCNVYCTSAEYSHEINEV